jgi:catechol 2,3-dioxygenase
MRLGHAHLKVRNLTKAIEFYTRVLGLQVTERMGDNMAFLSWGEAHHDLALQTLSDEGIAPHPYAVGLLHLAFQVENKQAFAQAFYRVRSEDIPFSAVDHRISWSLYFNDPDGNGLEIYYDTRKEPHGTPMWNLYSASLGATNILVSLEE